MPILPTRPPWPKAPDLPLLFRRFRATIPLGTAVAITYEDCLGIHQHREVGRPHSIFESVLHIRQSPHLLCIPLACIHNIEKASPREQN